ncbi:GntR family transcriptional regulator [Ramlibacter rhizophilus]|uniref:GntR family transcriptional regulator n=1 Tax=Ramlibacter rhizophilus TaxID=1781167 RepID=A0A4Z0C1K5_9BURK|nr:GntR family transcriptional regulator [Ramlibacter rhizophilus]TFZ04812.1 GntR family transcriptional regulator [Ramlibacter rhizophilus]
MPVAASPILARFQATPAGLPKHARLRQAIIGAVESGELPVGSKVTGERQLSEALGLSLGTTQKALGRLMDEGFLERRHGHGTFVGSARQAIAGSWHFRFCAPEGGPELPVFATIVERRIETADGPWSEVLGPDPRGYVLVRRRLDIGGKFHCASRMYLPASRFARLVRMAEKRLADTNLKLVLAEEFSAPTLHSEGLAFVRTPTPEDARLMGLWPESAGPGLQLHITGRSLGRIPISFQVVSVPPTPYALKLDFNPPPPVS